MDTFKASLVVILISKQYLQLRSLKCKWDKIIAHLIQKAEVNLLPSLEHFHHAIIAVALTKYGLYKDYVNKILFLENLIRTCKKFEIHKKNS